MWQSNFMAMLECLPDSTDNADLESGHAGELSMENSHEMDHASPVVDEMAKVQSMGKPDWVLNCSQLADHFTSHILDKHGSMNEVRVIFELYDVQHSLKQSIRDRILGSQTAVSYHITDSTNISKILMKRLLSHWDTKKELTGYIRTTLCYLPVIYHVVNEFLLSF